MKRLLQLFLLLNIGMVLVSCEKKQSETTYQITDATRKRTFDTSTWDYAAFFYIEECNAEGRFVDVKKAFHSEDGHDFLFTATDGAAQLRITYIQRYIDNNGKGIKVFYCYRLKHNCKLSTGDNTIIVIDDNTPKELHEDQSFDIALHPEFF